jgi:hypothetical protein
MSVSISFFLRSISFSKMPHEILHGVSAPPTTLRISLDVFFLRLLLSTPYSSRLNYPECFLLLLLLFSFVM